MDKDVAPVLPEDVQAGRAGAAPPSYEEVMGQFKTSVSNTPSEIPALAYIDIMPRVINTGNIKNKIPPVFQPFSQIIDGANMWLQSNPGMVVWKCETVERKVNAGDTPGGLSVDLESMCFHESTYGFNCFVFGLRLWLTRKPADQKGVQELGLLNITPKEKEVEVQVHSHMGMGLGRRGMRMGGVTMSQTKILTTFEGLKKTIGSFNGSIPGSVLNIESTTLKYAEGFSSNAHTDVAEASSWHEVSGISAKRFTQIIRVFYVKGPSTTPKIKMAEFLPSQISPPDWTRPLKFAGFDEVIGKATAWIQSQSGIKIVNVETKEAKVNNVFNAFAEIDTDTTDEVEMQALSMTKLKFLRIFYIPEPGCPPFSHTLMTSKLFVPIKLGPNKFETMTETMRRIDAWMKLSALPIFGVETVTYSKIGSPTGVDENKCDYSLKSFSGKHWVNAIRVYFPSAFNEPPAELLPPLPSKSKSSTCSVS